MPREERPRKIQRHWIQAVVAENLKAAMSKDGRSAAKLGADAKVGRKSVERLRSGDNSTLTTLGAVADALGMKSPVELMLVSQRTIQHESQSNVRELPTFPRMLGDRGATKVARKVRDRKKLTR